MHGHWVQQYQRDGEEKGMKGIVPAIVYFRKDINKSYKIEDLQDRANNLQKNLDYETGKYAIAKSMGDYKAYHRTDNYFGNQNLYMVRTIIHPVNSDIFSVLTQGSLSRVENAVGQPVVPAQFLGHEKISEDQVTWKF